MTPERVDPGSAHPGCVVCGGTNERGLRLRYAPADGNAVQAELGCEGSLQGCGGYTVELANGQHDAARIVFF